MGHKSNPIGLRLQINRTWDSRWYAEGRDYAKLLSEDVEIRKYIVESLPQAAISKVVIERPAKLCRILHRILPRCVEFSKDIYGPAKLCQIWHSVLPSSAEFEIGFCQAL